MTSKQFLECLKWKNLDCKSETLDLETTLTCGQAFRWRKYDVSTFIGVFAHRVWQVKHDKHSILFRVLACSHWTLENSNQAIVMPIFRTDKADTEYFDESKRCCECQKQEKTLLEAYFRLSVDLNKLYCSWNERDRKFTEIGVKFPGIRVLKQNPVETLISFLCTANNSISRIVPMIDKMCKKYGQKMMVLDGICVHDFPSLERLSQSDVENGLRKIGFGYRASYVNQCARQVLENGGESWLQSLSTKGYYEAVSELIKLHGVGMKVADCICLMSLGYLEAVPLDTHVRQVANRDYGYKVSKSFTNKSYKQLGDFFRELWGSYAGWTQAVLFVGEIKLLPHLYEFS